MVVLLLLILLIFALVSAGLVTLRDWVIPSTSAAPMAIVAKVATTALSSIETITNFTGVIVYHSFRSRLLRGPLGYVSISVFALLTVSPSSAATPP